MIRIEDKVNCVGCANCVQICPQQCIYFVRDEEGFFYPKVDEAQCLHCKKCDDACPVKSAPVVSQDKQETVTLGAYHKDLSIRMGSSSGGAFSAFALNVLKKGGAVFGASMVDSYHVKHIAIRSPKEISQIQGSKYVQSDLMGVFPQIKTIIESSSPVLFSGTPCQVKALYSFLGNRPQNLLTIEVVCHGVPSPMVFVLYMREENAVNMVFRNKNRSWLTYDVELTKTNGRIKRQRAANNLYMRGFLQNCTIRPACSQCPAKSFASGADITLGDFWGINRIAPGLFDDKGTSILFLHTKRGEKAWDAVKNELIFAFVPFDEAVSGNPCILQSAPLSNYRENFFNDLKHTSVRCSLHKYAGELPFSAIKRIFLLFWNFVFNLALQVKNGLLIIFDRLYSVLHNPPVVVGIEGTLQQILTKNYSACRFGDGELKLLCGKQTWFQEAHPLLKQRLQEILMNRQPNLLVCVPNVFGSLSSLKDSDQKYWRLHIIRNRKTWYKHMNRNRPYFDAFISRCYLPYIDKEEAIHYFHLWKRIWDKRDLLIIEGEKTRLGVGNDLFANTLSVKRILCSNTQAFSHYEKLVSSVLSYDRHYLVLLALGPTATVMAADLCSMGYQALDVGHLDIEYEWFLRRATGKIPIPGKFVNEAGAGRGVGEMDDERYLNEIICRC